MEKIFAEKYGLGFQNKKIGNSIIIHANCFDWMKGIKNDEIHAIVTDPPYGVKEYERDQLEKRANGNGGIWRIPPSFDGNERSPLPRFTALNGYDIDKLFDFFNDWAMLAYRILRPGGHIFLASNTYLSQKVFTAIANQGFEFRGQIIRTVRTLRGGDRPKNAENKFSDVCTMPRGCYEPWGLFRKPIPSNMRVSDCLNKYETGALRRKIDGKPFEDIIESHRTPKSEREIADHPSLKPQSFLRKIVYSSLPLGKGIILDPFMGSGSTIAAIEAVGYSGIGVERIDEYFQMSKNAIEKLSKIETDENQYPLF